tara:strand:+ start:303 stop:569 length:267 start_codon:yes stop_codon:yes gene_type:complete
MSAPTPRTDAAQFIQQDMEFVVSADFARTLERELTTERQKVRALTAILESICEEWGRNHETNPIGAGQKMSTIAGKVLEKLEQDEENS